jgi:hypothetical protein
MTIDFERLLVWAVIVGCALLCIAGIMSGAVDRY